MASELIKRAASLPIGHPERKRILASLKNAMSVFEQMSEESRKVVWGSFVYALRDKLNYGHTFWGKKPKDVRLKADIPNSRVLILDFPVPEVTWVVYDAEAQEIRITTKSGQTILNDSSKVHFRFGNVSANKKAGQELADEALLLLRQIQRKYEEKNKPAPVQNLQWEDVQKALESIGIDVVSYENHGRDFVLELPGDVLLWVEPFNGAFHYSASTKAALFLKDLLENASVRAFNSKLPVEAQAAEIAKDAKEYHAYLVRKIEAQRQKELEQAEEKQKERFKQQEIARQEKEQKTQQEYDHMKKLGIMLVKGLKAKQITATLNSSMMGSDLSLDLGDSLSLRVSRNLKGDINWSLQRVGEYMSLNTPIEGQVPNGDIKQQALLLVKTMVTTIPAVWAEIKAIQAEKEQQEKEEESDEVWSAFWIGRRHGYVTEVALFGSKQEAIDAAKDAGGGYVLKGTQMENEPMGQIEESNKFRDYRWYQNPEDRGHQPTRGRDDEDEVDSEDDE